MLRILLYIVPIAIGFFIFFDIRKTGRHYLATMVAISSVFFFPVIPIAYLFYRPKLFLTHQTSNSFCTKCGRNTTKNLKKCPQCGNTLII